MKQTAVEWLIEQISSSKYFYNLMEELESRSTTVQPNSILDQAKGMEKEQINDAHYDGYYQEGMADTRAYYDKKYKNKTI